MIKITQETEKNLINDGQNIGHFSDNGAIIGNAEFILVYKKDKIYLAHISEFKQKGMLIKLKK